MRKLLFYAFTILTLLLTFNLEAKAAGITLVQQKTATDAGGNPQADFDVGCTAGNSIVVLVATRQIATTTKVTVNLVGGGDGMLTLAKGTTTGTLIGAAIFYLHNIPSGVTGILAFEDDGVRVSINASEWSGLSNAVPEATNSAVAVASSTVATGSAAPSSAANLVIAVGAWTANNYSSGPTNSFTRLTQVAAVNGSLEGAYLIQAAATSNSTGWTLTVGINWAAAILTFGAPASGATPAQKAAGFFMTR